MPDKGVEFHDPAKHVAFAEGKAVCPLLQIIGHVAESAVPAQLVAPADTGRHLGTNARKEIFWRLD